MTINNTLKDKSFQLDIVTVCLTNDCEECTGSYSNEILRHRFVCHCTNCHHYKEKLGEKVRIAGAIQPTVVQADMSE